MTSVGAGQTGAGQTGTGQTGTGQTGTGGVGVAGPVSIGEAAARLGVSERSLRYWEQLGIISPSHRTPGGFRRYSGPDLERATRIRELQALLGFNLDEIRTLLDSEDDLRQVRREFHALDGDDERRRELLEEALSIREGLIAKVEAKMDKLGGFMADLQAGADKVRLAMAETAPI